VTVKEGIATSKDLADELKKHVRKVIGPVATPDEIRFTGSLPKTRSGKIMRRLLKQVAAGEVIKGDTTTLEDFGVLAKLAAPED
jgi:acetyl-CoA synthetase